MSFHVFPWFPNVFIVVSMVFPCFSMVFHGSFAGTIDVLIYKAKKKGGGSRSALADERPTPRFTELIDKRCLVNTLIILTRMGCLMGF